VLIRTGSASIELRKDGTIRIQGGSIDILGSTVNAKATNDLVLKGSKIRNN
jgi:type VI secretion system secreted protein VgrG